MNRKTQIPKCGTNLPSMGSLAIHLESVVNARQLGGYPAADGRVVKKNLLLRTGCLQNLTDDGVHILKNEYHLSKVIDFRSGIEVREIADRRIDGVEYIHLEAQQAENIDDPRKINVPLRSEFHLPEDETPFRRQYHDFAVGETATKAFRQFFSILLTQPEDESILFHCFMGKDRTGIAAALILWVLGVDYDAIEQDYLLTNVFVADKIEELLKKCRPITSDPKRLNLAVMCAGVDLKMLEYFRSCVIGHYGSFDSYFEKALELDQEKIRLLRSKYTEKAM